MNFEIDSSHVEKYAETLAKLHRSALPTAVRATLNTAAFDVKKNTLQKSAEKNFVNRDKNFFKAFSTVHQANGWNISQMQSEVGMMEKGLKGDQNYAVKDLEQQEHGGKIDKKSFIPMRTARTGRSDGKKVRNNARMSTINDQKITQLNNRSAKTPKQAFIRAAIYAKGKEDGLVLGHRTASGGRTLFRVDEVSINAKTRKMRMRLTPLYNVKSGRSVKVKKTEFMLEAASKSAKGMQETFNHEAERQIKKFMK